MSQEIRTRDSARKVKIISSIAAIAGAGMAFWFYDDMILRILGIVMLVGGLIAFVVGRFME